MSVTQSIEFACPFCGARLECAKLAHGFVSPTLCPSCDGELTDVDWEGFFPENPSEQEDEVSVVDSRGLFFNRG